MAGTGEEEGFTLLELVIALGIITFAIGGLLSVFGAALRTTAVDVHRTDAVALATRELASLRALAAPPAASPTSHPATVNGQTYSITDTVGWQRSSGGVDRAYGSVSVLVAWTDQAGSQTVEQDSAVPPPSGPAPGPGDCTAGPAAVSPVVTAAPGPPGGLDVSWNEPAGPPAVARWEIDTSPDGVTWTAAVWSEPPLPPGALHQVELGGLAPASPLTVRIGAFGACPPSWVQAPTGVAPGGAPGASCTVGSTSLGAPIATRPAGAGIPGALSGDVTVAVSSEGPCPGGLWAGVGTSAGGVSRVGLAPEGAALYTGRLVGTDQPWDLGRHLVEIFAGSPAPGPLPSTPLAVAVLCVEPSGTASC